MIPATSSKLKVLIVDDSSFMRMAIRGILTKAPGVEIVGIAADGMEGVEKALALKPDLITMDVEMPRMDGIAALKQIMAKQPTRVLMVSTLTCEGARATFEALEAGAIDYVPKNVSDCKDAQAMFQAALLEKVREAAVSAIPRRAGIGLVQRVAPPVQVRPSQFANRRVGCVGIGASTGGPVALQEVISRIPVNFPHGIVVAIHMPKAFTGPYAERLNAKCSLSIREAVDGDIVKGGQVLIAPGGMHTSLVKQGSNIVVRTQPTSDFPQYIYIPSVDQMITSMADASNGAMLGVILTGMGNDGFKGMKHLKEKGGITLVQNEATSTIYGMPRACIDGKVADVVLPLDQIGFEIGKIG
ncbi:chemotaxis response regulator protein-glutamate methylesterase [Geomonas paludis]|uniref:Protein-glutamate methylesterase/protein-glutamine glutaminase n=1 Tax=Geomonas paludis TaxID=2740185 RepID=A0A6V8MR44_9BACT|nr:chemotaxis response regulator protein-glutamate methylesterase [Geomonas paludis]UPU36251.1 chemotaxis response regulator protein-glutamate methylesterase [Geomonas paludis]GFO62133.1 chemotaxis response regulator protein-glutamate methylesterase of group 1 operon [Geomonas paludis]